VSPAVARALMPGVDRFRYCGLVYTLLALEEVPTGVYLAARGSSPDSPVRWYPVAQCDVDRRPAPARTPAKRKVLDAGA
jgi:hypothetical protein